MSQQHAICSGPLSRSGGGFWIAPKVLCLSQNQRKSGKSGQGGLTKLWFFVTLLLSERTQNSACTPWQVNPSSFWSHEFPSFSLLFIKKNALPWVPKTKIWIANCVLSVKKSGIPWQILPRQKKSHHSWCSMWLRKPAWFWFLQHNKKKKCYKWAGDDQEWPPGWRKVLRSRVLWRRGWERWELGSEKSLLEEWPVWSVWSFLFKM